MSAAEEPAAPPATGEVLVLRPWRAVVLSVIGAVVLLGLFVAIAVVLRNSPTGVYFRLADQVAMVLLGVLLAGGVLLLARPRVRADARGVEVRNTLGTRRFDWADVQRVSFPDGASWARLDLPDYEYVPVLALQAADRGRAVEGITRLRALHAASRAR
ncbi:PH domain-containing protein [Pseudonocardia humida]|uniref:PH domain-containing protein n=1 Tax=Pseudonocardia humida TaxID=2800819 RepID=UPI00207D6F56|nr:PH domain-containing protein [Pseudonocardia humida]